MRPFEYVRAADAASATAAMSAMPQAKYLAGGSNLLDLMKEDIERPMRLVDITRLPLREIQRTRSGLSIGALATNTDSGNVQFAVGLVGKGQLAVTEDQKSGPGLCRSGQETATVHAGIVHDHPNSRISASAFSSQYVMPMSRYMAVAVVRCSWACSRLRARR